MLTAAMGQKKHLGKGTAKIVRVLVSEIPESMMDRKPPGRGKKTHWDTLRGSIWAFDDGKQLVMPPPIRAVVGSAGIRHQRKRGFVVVGIGLDHPQLQYMR